MNYVATPDKFSWHEFEGEDISIEKRRNRTAGRKKQKDIVSPHELVLQRFRLFFQRINIFVLDVILLI
jgi:hypothetical protein